MNTYATIPLQTLLTKIIEINCCVLIKKKHDQSSHDEDDGRRPIKIRYCHQNGTRDLKLENVNRQQLATNNVEYEIPMSTKIPVYISNITINLGRKHFYKMFSF